MREKEHMTTLSKNRLHLDPVLHEQTEAKFRGGTSPGKVTSRGPLVFKINLIKKKKILESVKLAVTGLETSPGLLTQTQPREQIMFPPVLSSTRCREGWRLVPSGPLPQPSPSSLFYEPRLCLCRPK